MKYIVYITTNKNNNKIYVGVHGTKNPDIFDGYLGCGAFINKPTTYNKNKTHFHNAILKHGVSVFIRKTLKVFDTEEEALSLEKKIVNEHFVKRTDTYNMTIGGNIPPKHFKIIYEFDLTGKLIKTWNSIKEIIETYNINDSRIRMCINDKRSFNNSYWSDKNIINVTEYKLSSRGYVFQYNKNGDLLNSFENATEASKQLDIDRSAISNAVFNRTTCCGYYFLRADENIDNLLNEKSSKKLANVTKVYKYDLKGNYICDYNSIKDAVQNTFKTNHGNIIRAIKNNRTCGGFKWSYIKSEKLQPFTDLDLKPVKIAQYDLNNNLIKIWESSSECKKEFPSCLKVCRQERKTSKGFIFKYIS